MNKSYAKTYVIIATIIMIMLAISSGYAIGKSKREVYQKENEINELKNEFKRYEKNL